MEVQGTSNDFSGRFNPNFRKLTAIQVNPFVKFKGLEFFGIYEIAMSGDNVEANNNDDNGNFSQYGAELIYRIGEAEKFYLGGRYNMVTGEANENANEQTISRFNIGGGWFLTKNIVTKVEYVSQEYSGDGWLGTAFEGGSFNGVMIEAAISF
jgi:hypothetical protein